jgi:hypothetical protein
MITRLSFAALLAVGLGYGYFKMSSGLGTNADGASITVQAWQLTHGNPLLRGWTVADVSFYGNELFQYAGLERVIGLRPDVLRLAPAVTWTITVFLVGLLAMGSARGPARWVRVLTAGAIVVLPQSGLGVQLLLSAPDHAGTSVPILLTWLILDRARCRSVRVRPRNAGRPATGQTRITTRPGWLPWALAGLLAWAQIGDGLVLLLGALPLVVVGASGLARDRRWTPGSWRGLDAALVAAGVGSVLLAQAAMWALRRAGGFSSQPLTLDLAHPGELLSHLRIAAESVAVLFGSYFPDLHGWAALTLGSVRLVGIGLAVGAVGLVVLRAVRGARDRLNEVLVAGIGLTLVAFVLTRIAGNILTAREIAPLLPLAAVLVARVWVPATWSPRPRRWSLAPVVAASVVAGLLVGGFVQQARVPAVPAAGAQLATWLRAQHLDYGLGGYWVANTITLDTAGAVQVAPLTGNTPMRAYRWESQADWYDPHQHDARFVVIDEHTPSFGTVAQATAQFGRPVRTKSLDSAPGRPAVVLVYDHNLLTGLPAWCGPGRNARSMADCD